MSETEPREGIVNQTLEKKEKTRHLIIGLHGAIGAGKTELASLLSRELGLVHFQEKFTTNPYLEDFYRNPKSFSYLMESHFLKDKVEQMRSISCIAKKEGVIIDPTLWQDVEIYAWVHHQLGWMTDGQYEDYLMHYRGYCCSYDLQIPDMIISVHASVETIEARIRQRNRPYEIAMLKQFPGYFAEIARRTDEWVEQNSQRVPVMEVDSGNYNYAVNSATQAMIINNVQLKATGLFGDHPEIKLPQELRYIRPNSDPSVGREYLKH